MCSPTRVCCFFCYRFFDKNQSVSQCTICGDYKCALCGACLCTLTPGERRVALAMMRTYEPLLGNDYDFSIHSAIEKSFLETKSRDFSR
jgi:hypothetical protein